MYNINDVKILALVQAMSDEG